MDDDDATGVCGLRGGAFSSRPATRIWPVSGFTTPEAILANVDFPAPLAPIKGDDFTRIN